jgi:glycosyltransferase involved in cell wall biosynthesis
MSRIPRLCIVSPNRNVWSETFIANHIAHLPGVELVLTDGHLPKRDVDGAPLVHPTLLKRVVQRIARKAQDDVLRNAVTGRLRKARIDVVLAEYGPTGEAMLPICRRLGIPLVVHFHGIDAFHVKLLKENAQYASILREAAAIVVVSREMEQQLLSLGCPKERLHYSCYGIDVEHFKQALPERSGKRFLAVGRFVDKKAPHLTIAAFHQAWQQDPEMKLTMAGDGPLRESTVSLARALGVEAAVEFPGVITQDQVSSRLQQARAFVQHSVVTADNDHEGTPLSILEAMASGVPVVATRHAGIPDVVEDGVSGLLCAEQDVRTMAMNLVRLAADPALAGAMGLAGRAKAERDFRLEDSLDRLHNILRRTIRG